MGIQNELLKLGGSVLAIAGLSKKIKAKQNKQARTKAKQDSSKNTDIKRENAEIIKQKLSDTPSRAGFGIEEITANNSQTNIPVDEEVSTLIQVRQKNLNRVLGGQKAAEARKASLERMQKISGQKNIKPEDYEFRKIMNNFSDAELKKAGYTKTQLKEMAVKAAFDPENLVNQDQALMDRHFEGKDWTSEEIEDVLFNSIKEKTRPEIDTRGFDFSGKNEVSESKYFVWDENDEEELSEEEKLEQGIVF